MDCDGWMDGWMEWGLLGNVSSCWNDTVGHGRVHDSLRLIIHHFAVLVALPCAFVLLERRVPEFECESDGVNSSEFE